MGSFAVYGGSDMPGPMYPEQDVATTASNRVILGCDWTCDRCGARLREIGRGRAMPWRWSRVSSNCSMPGTGRVEAPPQSTFRVLCPDCTEVHEDFLKGAGPGRDV